MENKKVIKKWVGKTGMRTRKITTLGLRNLFGKGPQIIPYIRTIYQKKSGPGSYKSMEFSPSDYDSLNSLERKEMAHQDALNHRNFYNELIKQGIYPTETKVRVKKGRHSNVYILEISMPKVKEFHRELKKKEFEVNEGDANLKEVEEMLRKQKDVQYSIEHIAKERGKLQSGNQKYEPIFYEDLGERFNYGIDKDKRIVYTDQHILVDKLPFKRRKERGSLEKRLSGFIAIGSIIICLFFLSSNFTGFTIANLTQRTSNIIGIVLFIASLVGLFFIIKRRKN